MFIALVGMINSLNPTCWMSDMRSYAMVIFACIAWRIRALWYMSPLPLGAGCDLLRERNILPLPGYPIYNVRARIGRKIALSSYEFACLFGSLGDFSLPLHSQKKRTA